MFLGMIILAVLISGFVAVTALVAGYSFWMALVIYSGIGVLVMFTAAAVLMTAREGGASQADVPQQRLRSDTVISVLAAAPDPNRTSPRDR